LVGRIVLEIGEYSPTFVVSLTEAPKNHNPKGIGVKHEGR
jgi:hypothetical protein